MENRLNLRKIALLAGAALLSTSAMAAPLMDGTVTRTETVKYSLSSAATPEGAAALYQKLHETAVRVCGEADPAAAWLYTPESLESCVSEALDKAVRRIGVPMITALHVQSVNDRKLASARKLVPAKTETVASR